MNKEEVLIQAVSAIPSCELFNLKQPLTCGIGSASLVCILGQRNNILNTYMEMLAGINEPSHGSLNYCDDLFINDCSAIRYIYHNSALLSILNGVDNIKLPALYHHLGPKNEIDSDADALLAELDYQADHKILPAFMDILQKRYLLIVRAIMLKPRILFIENPFMDLDREQVRVFGKYLAGLVKEKNMTVIVSNINLDFVQSYADQIIYFRSGEIQVFKERETFSRFIQSAT